MTEPNAPIDDLHAECLAARAEIRAQFAWARQLASEWNLRDCPPTERTTCPSPNTRT